MTDSSSGGMNALEAGEKLSQLRRLASELRAGVPAGVPQLAEIDKLAEQLVKEVIELDVKVAPKLYGEDAARLPVLH